MLVLSRARAEAIEVCIEGVTVATIRVVSIRGSRVQLGMTGDGVQFRRTELDTVRRKSPLRQHLARVRAMDT